jgi:hypothetical protein
MRLDGGGVDSHRLSELIGELDDQVPVDGAIVQFIQYGGGPDESKIIANRLGYLRLGIEFLKGGIAIPSGAAPSLVNVVIDYLTDDNSNISFDWFEHTEALTGQHGAQLPAWKRRLIGATLWFVVLTVAVLAGVGAITVFRSLTGRS